MAGQHLTVSETARRLSVTTRTVRRWVADGFLPAAKIPGRGGGEWRIPGEAVDKLLSGRVEPKGTSPMDAQQRCQGVTSSGERCRGIARRRSKFCRHHQKQASEEWQDWF
jgi:excisionase family DNA binding protein